MLMLPWQALQLVGLEAPEQHLGWSRFALVFVVPHKPAQFANISARRLVLGAEFLEIRKRTRLNRIGNAPEIS